MEPRVTVFLSNRTIDRIPLGQAGSMTRLAESLGRRVILDTARLALHIDSVVDGRSIAIDPAPDDESFGLACTVAGILAAIGARTVLARGAHERPSAWQRRGRIRASAVDLTLHLGFGDPMVAYPVWPPASSARAAALLARAVGCHFPTRTIPGRSWAGWSPAVWLTARDPAAVCRGVVLFFRGRAQASGVAAQEVDLGGEYPSAPLDSTWAGDDEPMPAAEQHGGPVGSGSVPTAHPAPLATTLAPATVPGPPAPAPRPASAASDQPAAVPAHPAGHVFRPTPTAMAPMVQEGDPQPPPARGPGDAEDCGGKLLPFR